MHLRLRQTLPLFAAALFAQSSPALELLPPDSPVQASVSGLLDLETYWSDGLPPALIFPHDRVLFNPRATLFGDIHLGSHLFAFAQARFDRGFDPGGRPDGDARLEEYALRWTPFDKPVVNIQAGKFATVFGAWVPRHLSWDNPFINAPLPYENITVAGDGGAPASAQAFLNRHGLADKKALWLPVIWGPSYGSGASISGRIDQADYAFEVKNTSLSSRPYAWGADVTGFDSPTWTGRVGWRPNAAWNFGLSGSTGAYILNDPMNQLPKGTGRGDYKQNTVGFDASYAHHHLELWSEVIASRFEVPRAGDADSLAWFIESKYKITPNLFAALRLNQQVFNSPGNGAGRDSVWDRDIFRIDFALGYRLSRNLQLKVQYSVGHENGPNANADQLVATQLTLRF